MAKKNKKNNEPKIVSRAPVVAVMGHIDHGKSTLLDYIRKENTVDKEAGGITQHVAGYEAVYNDEKIVFIDTPGHEAFAAARSRGANIADIAVLVVSAEDGVKEQTLGALKFIQDSKIPFIVAINKIDKPNADINKTKNTLIEHGIYLEGMGGDIPFIEVSALKGTNIDKLLDLILLTAEVEDLKADLSKLGSGYVLESKLDSKRGISATMILKDGYIKTGQFVVSNTAMSPVRILEDFQAKGIKEAEASSVIVVTGFDENPEAGGSFIVFENKKEAQKYIDEIKELEEIQKQEENSKPISRRRRKEEKNIFPLIIKADAQGSVDAILHQLKKINNERSEYKVVMSGVGNIGDKELKMLVADSNATIVGFNVKSDRKVEMQAEKFGIDIKNFDIIYKLEEYLEERLEKLTPKEMVEERVGEIKILKVFSWNKNEGVIGGEVLDGEMTKDDKIKLSRRGIFLSDVEILNLQKGKQKVEKVLKEDQFGLNVKSDYEIIDGDILEVVREVEK